MRRDKAASSGCRSNGCRSMRNRSPLVTTVVNAGSLVLVAVVEVVAVVEELLVVMRESMDGRERMVVVVVVAFFFFLTVLFACSAPSPAVDECCCFRGSTLSCSVRGYDTTPTGACARATARLCLSSSLPPPPSCVVKTLTWMPTVPVKVEGAVAFRVEWFGDAQLIHLTAGSVVNVCG